MNWEILFFETARGEKVVKEFIKTLDDSTVSKISHEIDLLEAHGLFLGMPHSKKITQDLYELRIRGRQEVRIIYGFAKKSIYLLHVFLKKTEKTPSKEIKISEQRFISLKKFY